VSTGGATPLHMCGMSRRSELHTALLIERGGDVEAVDTYGFRPLHRMASNNLAIGAKALLDAGADLDARTSRGETAMDVARQSGARAVQAVLIEFINKRNKVNA
jgi:ankyrin repeat protein